MVFMIRLKRQKQNASRIQHVKQSMISFATVLEAFVHVDLIPLKNKTIQRALIAFTDIIDPIKTKLVDIHLKSVPYEFC